MEQVHHQNAGAVTGADGSHVGASSGLYPLSTTRFSAGVDIDFPDGQFRDVTTAAATHALSPLDFPPVGGAHLKSPALYPARLSPTRLSPLQPRAAFGAGPFVVSPGTIRFGTSPGNKLGTGLAHTGATVVGTSPVRDNVEDDLIGVDSLVID